MREIICYCLQDDPESEELEIFRETKKNIETEAFKRIMGKTPKMQLYIKTDSPDPFWENKLVAKKLADEGEAAFPLVFLDGVIYRSGKFIETKKLAAILGIGISIQREKE